MQSKTSFDDDSMRDRVGAEARSDSGRIIGMLRTQVRTVSSSTYLKHSASRLRLPTGRAKVSGRLERVGQCAVMALSPFHIQIIGRS